MSEGNEMDDIIKEFLVEGGDHLDRLDNDFVAIEQNPSDRPLMASIFRSIHTIKGGAGLLGFTKLEKLSHSAESLLSLLRDGKLTLQLEMTTALLATVDAIRKMFAIITETGHDGEETYQELIQTLIALQDKDAKPKVSAAPVEVAPQESPDQKNESIEIAVAAQNLASIEPTGPIVKAEAEATPQTQSAEVSPSVASAQAQNHPEVHKEGAGALVSESAIRVDVSLLDKLMNLAGELVLARNNVLQFASKFEDSGFQASIQRINQITSELREGVMKTRMQPIGNIWSKFPRVVRDLAKACGKQVALEMDGEKTELDKTLIEAIRDPLTHLIRNAVDHGVETPEVRKFKGKPVEGRLLLRASHEGGQVNIEIVDDGGGIDAKKIFSKAVEKGLLSADQKDKMDEREMLNLIFLPGFSTAEKVTNVSGRGVGMDVVRTNIEKIGGTIDIISRPEKGTTFKLKIPLTLAIIPALTVSCRQSCYAIPQLNVVELVRLSTESIHGAIEMFQNVPVYRLRGKLLPLVYLNKILDNEVIENDNQNGLNIVVMQADERPFGLVVDEIIDTQEIVVKPLGQQLKDVPVYAGATMMGDGKIALILDVMNIAQAAKVVGKIKDKMTSESEESSKKSQDHHSLLLVRSKDDGRIVIPLSVVARLEEFSSSSVEWAGGQATIQYRGEIIPLISLSEILPERRREMRRDDEEVVTKKSDRIQAVVYSKNGRTVGVIVDKVLDIVGESQGLQKAGARPGIIGTTVIQGRLAEVLDVEGVIQMAIPGFCSPNDVVQTEWQGDMSSQEAVL